MTHLARPHATGTHALHINLVPLATGYKFWIDELDGYSFLYPANWLPVKVRFLCCSDGLL